jgi:hypothetical protein
VQDFASLPGLTGNAAAAYGTPAHYHPAHSQHQHMANPLTPGMHPQMGHIRCPAHTWTRLMRNGWSNTGSGMITWKT